MELNLAPRVRFVIYVLTAIASPIVGYLFTRGILGEQEVALFGSLVTVVNGLAAINVNSK